MQFAPTTAAIGFPACTCALRERASEEPLASSQLRDPRTEVALRGREFGAIEGFVHLVHY